MITSRGIQLLLALVAIAAQAVQEFKVEGVMRTTSSAFPPSASRVQIRYRGSEWCIREIMKARVRNPETFPADVPVPEVLVHSLSTEGTNIYFVEHFETNSLESVSFDQPNPIGHSVAHIYGPGFPDPIIGPSMVMLFYAYLSTRYLDSVTNNVLYPILDPWGGGVRATYKRTSDELGLPTEIVFLSYGNAESTNAVFQATHFMNMFGVRLPKRVLTRTYGRDGQVGMSFDFQVSMIGDKQPPSVSLRPEIDTGALVFNDRFFPAMSYGDCTNWPTETEAEHHRRNVIPRSGELDSLQKLRPYYDSLRRGLDRESLPK